MTVILFILVALLAMGKCDSFLFKAIWVFGATYSACDLIMDFRERIYRHREWKKIRDAISRNKKERSNN